MQFVVATHGHCFDGLASAAVFTHLLRELGNKASICYRACGYGVDQRRAVETLIAGDENAVLDYRFTTSERLTWYFDHHRTAFASETERDHFENRRQSGRFFFDSTYTSCTKLIADVAKKQFGISSAQLAPLIDWADLVDSAAFESAEHALDCSAPIRQLVSVVERYGDDALLAKLVPRLLEEPLQTLAIDKEIRKRFEPIRKRQDRFKERVQQKGERLGRVILVDLTDKVLDTIGKFVTYALFPQSTYSVVVALLKNGTKISVGYNPWCGLPRDADISAICARYGGGGHPVVGAIQFRAEELERARLVAREIAVELNG